MALHLSYDGKQNNGIIYNATYQGAMFNGVEFRPSLSFECESFMYSEVFTGQPNYVILADGTKRLMLAEEEAEVIQLATNWVQPLGQEGNPTQAQKDAQAAIDLKNSQQSTLDSSTVTVDNLVFQSDEKSINFMTASILTSETTGITYNNWKMADNSIVMVTIAQLRTAQALAMQQLANIKAIS